MEFKCPLQTLIDPNGIWLSLTTWRWCILIIMIECMDMIWQVEDYIIHLCEVVGFLDQYYHNYIDDEYDNDNDVDGDVDVNDDYACGRNFWS